MALPVAEPIAIIGSACHFANVSTPSELWELLKKPRDVRREIPDDRFSASGFYHERHTQPGHTNVRHGYLMDEDLSAFDAEFFGLKPVEAKAVDPQQRWLLETGLESAGLTIQGMKGSDTAVFVGVMSGDYEAMLLRDLQATPTYFATGTARSILSNRISHFFDWHGPSVTVDTACSSSLVALHMAVQALRTGDSSVAVACGSNLILGPENFIIESKLKMLSPDGISRMWDQNANGYARGDGVAAIVLKTLSAAIADGDDIECIVRETGINQDGATPGITIPSAEAQQALIRSTYSKAGLDISKAEDRPQYFEAHGTGTPAGDPIEARAIQHAFFGEDGAAGSTQPHAKVEHLPSPLFVGSIKTVLGHTEGTAGLAGILKASLAVQNGLIPPNLHLSHLSNSVSPYYKNIEIVRGAARPWPQSHSGDGLCRRVSVNSFGFGGANAHAILESYGDSATGHGGHEGPLFTPFVFSASSEYSLRATMHKYATLLDQTPLLDAHDLAWTLRQRRTLFSHRLYVAADSIQDLKDQIASMLQKDDGAVGVRGKSYSTTHTILGVFTGQGAQFARVAAELIENSPLARRIIQELESHLASLPPADRPSWSLTAELLATGASTRVGEAAIAQPLCTAIQIMLVDLLAVAGIHFDAVVGHSSGEIGAAYAAGVLSARDAMLIAYFRGVYVGRAMSPNGGHIHGAMIAVGTSMADASELCEDDLYAGRLSVAACNSSSSVTISGDEDAIQDLQELLDDEKKFHRRLRVDTAYHSQHMNPCYMPYVEALKRSGIQPLKPAQSSRKCDWYSSVYDCVMDTHRYDGLDGEYWAENMTRPVLFAQALKTALDSTRGTGFSLTLEIGPHPALQGPAFQTIQEVLGRTIPYHSTLVRGVSSVKALSSTLGFLWQHLQRDHTEVPNLEAYESAMASDEKRSSHQQQKSFKLIKGLPTYPWNHTTKYWAESRASRRMRLRKDVYHPLLGHRTPDSSRHHLIWRNLLRAEKEDDDGDVLQLNGHRVQGQTVFPAAGYIATAVEAARALPQASPSTSRSPQSEVTLIEINNLVIHQAVVLASNTGEGVEVLIELDNVRSILNGSRMKARFSYSAAIGDDDELALAASAEIEVRVGEKSDSQTLPMRRPLSPHLVPVEKDRFYTSLASLGYEYEGIFKSLTDLKRKHGQASCVVDLCSGQKTNDASKSADLSGTKMLLHPAHLDSAFQSLLLAYSYPEDHQLRTLHLPLSIECIRVNPALCHGLVQSSDSMNHRSGNIGRELALVDAKVVRPSKNGCSLPSLSQPKGGFQGDIDIFTTFSPHAAVQVQNVQLVPLGGSANEDEDRKVFLEMQWVNMAPDGHAAALADRPIAVSQQERDQLAALKRLAVFYYRQFAAQVPSNSALRLPSESGATAYFLQYGEHILSSLPADWPNDTAEDIQKVTQVCDGLPDVDVMHLVGRTMPGVFRGETTMLEAFRETGVLDDYYIRSFSSAPSGRWQTRLVDQIATRRPRLNILEIGAGTGGTTKPILKSLGDRFQSYTFTDVSAGFFGAAANVLSLFSDRLAFKTLDIERDPCSQGFQEGAYDLIVASFVLHATASLSRTLSNARRLLRPGGFLVVGEGSVQTTPVSSFIFGPLPGWWLGRDDGRVLSPHASAADWDRLLRENGFSGIDTKAPDEWEDVLGVCLFASQAVDDRTRFLRSPFLDLSPKPELASRKLVLVGGETPRVSRLLAEVKDLLGSYDVEIDVHQTLADVDFDGITTSQSAPIAVLSLVDLDKPVFKDMTETGFSSLRRTFSQERTILWVTSGRRSEEPFSNMIVGFGRTAVHETPGLNLQHLDVADPQMDGFAHTIAETFLRLLMIPTTADKDPKTMWVVEPEIVVEADGRHRVARLIPLRDPNLRYNSGRRLITRDVDIEDNPVAISRDESGNFALERVRAEIFEPVKETADLGCSVLNLRVMYAVVPGIRTPLGHMFLAVGLEAITGSTYLLLLPSLASLVSIPATAALRLPESICPDWKTLSLLADQLTALFILKTVLPGQAVVVHNVTASLAEAISSQAMAKNVLTAFIVDEGADHGQSAKSCTILPRYNGPIVLDFTVQTRLPVRVRRLDATGAMFKHNMTYWVVGLSGDLGISLCDWMIGTGARHIVLTSRNPNIDKAWMESHFGDGVHITIIPCDITSYPALTAVHAQIRAEHPPIAGVFNGAMVLRDTFIRNMAFTQLEEVVQPKVTGSLNLDRIFSASEPPLDFFVLFSSTNFTIGNQGQANYAAANAFQCALAASRRGRGLAACAVNIGAIIGAGYIQRSTNYRRVLDLTVTRGNMMHLSEEDFHQLIAEAIEAGRPGHDGVAELSTGLMDVEHDTTSPPLWFSDPKFAHLTLRRNGNRILSAGKTEPSATANSPAAFKERLKSCRSPMDCEQMTSEAFAAQLRQELQITGTPDTELMELRSNEIGLDSLVSVDIRSWFLRMVGVSIPVLRIMSNNTMGSLVQLAVESLELDMAAQASTTSADGDEMVEQSEASSDITTPSESVSDHNSTSHSQLPKERAQVQVDWEAETCPPTIDADLDRQLRSIPGWTPSPSAEPRTLVLTGVSGLLGSHLLDYVLSSLPTVARVICIGVRRSPPPHADPRVKFYPGDLSAPRLGLSVSDTLSIFATADAVIHVAADTSHLKPYAALRATNVGSTAELARLCLARRVPLHYVSTVGVGFFSGGHELRPQRVSGGTPGPESEGYTTSKWVCERMLERMHADTGLPVWIHRPSAILRLGRDNEGDRARMDWLNGLLRYVWKLRAVPEVTYNKGALDLVYARSVCERIVKCVLDGLESRTELKGVRYVHEVGDIVIPLSRMHQILHLDLESDRTENIQRLKEGEDSNTADHATSKCEVLPMGEWAARARAQGLHPAVVELIEGMDGPDKPQFPSLIKS
ncbi:Type I Iterative PKS [Diaporthe australafricana]|uniref:Type I Iterative PKS n=1 Tax=Diaporthe australafricana TaxID=127596 RepID=A0ABR3WAZ8_9PEZI